MRRRGQRRRGIHRAAAVVTEKQPLQQIHAVAKHGNGQRGQYARDGGNQKPAKHRADIGVSMKTMHGSRVNGVDAILWREMTGLAKGLRAGKPGRKN